MEPIQSSLLLDELTSQPIGVGLFLAGAGVVFLLLGHRIFKALVAISFGGLGYLLGSSLSGGTPPAQILIGLVTGGALAVASLLFIRAAVALLAGGWCVLIVFQLGSGLQLNEYVLWAVALFAFAIAISLALIMYEEIIAFVTSLEGAFLCVGALVIFASRSPLLWSNMRELLLSNPFFGPFIVMAGTVTGFYMQLSELRHKTTGVHV